MRNRKQNSGFTLIELMIVIGIIAVLVVVLAIAVIPWIAKSDVQATKTLITQLGPVATGNGKVLPTIKQFRKDAGSLSGRISSNQEIASSQMILFYAAPERTTWEQSDLYKDQNYAPELQPEEFGEFTRSDAGLPYIVDSWDNPVWYEYDKKLKTGYVLSKGEDGMWDTPDDIIFSSSTSKVLLREEMQ